MSSPTEDFPASLARELEAAVMKPLCVAQGAGDRAKMATGYGEITAGNSSVAGVPLNATHYSMPGAES
jgi:hypothetical protein